MCILYEVNPAVGVRQLQNVIRVYVHAATRARNQSHQEFALRRFGCAIMLRIAIMASEVG